MNRQLKQGGLSLNPQVRDHRLHDRSPITNVLRSIEISVGRMTARHTTELSLAGPVRLIAVYAFVAGARRVAWINQPHRCPYKPRFVGEKSSELTKGPVAVPCPLRVLNRSPLPDALEVFKDEPSRGAFRTSNDTLTDAMIRVCLEAALPAAQLLQVPFRALGADRLKGRASLPVPLASGLNPSAAVHIPVAVGGKVDDAKVDAEGALTIVCHWLVNGARHKEVELPLAIYHIALTLSCMKQAFLSLTGNKWDGLSSLYGPDRDEVFVGIEGENPIIKGNTAKWLVATKGLVVEFVAIADFGKAANDHLCTKVIVGLDANVGQFLKVKLPKRLLVPGNVAYVVTGSVGRFKRAAQRVGLLGQREELDLGDQLHLSESSMLVLQAQGDRGFPPSPKGGGFQPIFL
jgi:hypothetical protein